MISFGFSKPTANEYENFPKDFGAEVSEGLLEDLPKLPLYGDENFSDHLNSKIPELTLRFIRPTGQFD